MSLASVIDYVIALDTSSTVGAGKTGLAFGDITAKYLTEGGTLVTLTTETITTLGTYQAPTSNAHIRIKELNSAEPTKGVYEVHFHTDQVAVAGKKLKLFLSATGSLFERYELPLFDIHGRLPAALTANGNMKSSLLEIISTLLMEGATGRIAAAWQAAWNVVSSVWTAASFNQTGDSFARIGAAGAGLTALGDTRIANLDATVSSRASSTEVLAIQNNTRVVRVVPTVIERPDAGTQEYRIELLLYDEVGNMEAPDSAPTIALVDQGGTDLSARLDSATMALVSTGRYRAVYTASVGDDLEQLIWSFSVIEGGNTRAYGNTTIIVDTTAVDFTATDRANLALILGDTATDIPALIAALNDISVTQLWNGDPSGTPPAAGSYGDIVNRLGLQVAVTGTVQASPSPTTTTFRINSSYDLPTNANNDALITFTSGGLYTQTRPILSITRISASVHDIVVSEAFTSAPATGNACTVICTTHIHPVSQIQSGLATSSALAAVNAVVTAIAAIFTGMTNLPFWIMRQTRKDAGTGATATGMAAAAAEMNVGGGGFDYATESLEATANAAGGGPVEVGSFAPAALDQLVLEDTGQVAAAAGSVAQLAQGAAGSGLVTDFTDEALAEIRATMQGAVIIVRGPVSQDGEEPAIITLVIGDDYLDADGRAIEFDLDGTTLPDLTDATVVLRLQPSPKDTMVEIDGEVTVPTGATKSIRFEPTSAETMLLAVSSARKGDGIYEVHITDAAGHEMTPLEIRGELITVEQLS